MRMDFWRWSIVVFLLAVPYTALGQCTNAVAPAAAGGPALTAPTPNKPAHKSTGVAGDTSISWNKVAGATSYDISFGTSNPPKFVVNQAGTTYSPGGLQASTDYYWSVTPCNGTSPGPAGGPWKFTTTDSGSSIPSSSSGAQSFLQSMGFGVALALQWNILAPDIVNDASIDANGIVRVNTRANTGPGFMLEGHALPWSKGQWGFGPFVAVQPGGSSQIISSVGAGFMADFKLSTDPKNKQGFGLGFGYASIPAAKTLGDEFVPNQPAPTGPGGTPLPIRFETRDKGAVLFVLSFTFR
jgi:hypothetical protein